MKKFNYKKWITERKWRDDHFDPNDPDGQHRSMRKKPEGDPFNPEPSRAHTPIDGPDDEPVETGCPCPEWMGGGYGDHCCTIDEHNDGTDHNHNNEPGDNLCTDFDNPEAPRCWYCKGGGNPCVQVGTPGAFPTNFDASNAGMSLYPTKPACLSAPGNEECRDDEPSGDKKKRCQCCINGQPHSMNQQIPTSTDCSQHFGYLCADHSLSGGPSHIQFAERCSEGRGNDNGNADVLRYRCDAGGCLQCPPGATSAQCPYSNSNCDNQCSRGSGSQQLKYEPDKIITLPDGTQTKPRRNEQLRETIQKIKRIIKRSHLNEQVDVDMGRMKMPDLQQGKKMQPTDVPTQDGPEQQMAAPPSSPGIRLLLRTCTGGLTLGSSYCYNDLGGMAVGDVVKITAGGLSSVIGRTLFVKSIHGSCGSPYLTIQSIPSGPGVCRNCCFSSWGGAGNSTPSGACTAANTGGFGCCINGPSDPSCTTTSSTGCDPSQWSNYSSWVNSWSQHPVFGSSNPNQPCNFICNRIQLWSSQIPNVGPQWANMLQCKLDEANNQSQIHGCNC